MTVVRLWAGNRVFVVRFWAIWGSILDIDRGSILGMAWFDSGHPYDL